MQHRKRSTEGERIGGTSYLIAEALWLVLAAHILVKHSTRLGVYLFAGLERVDSVLAMAF